MFYLKYESDWNSPCYWLIHNSNNCNYFYNHGKCEGDSYWVLRPQWKMMLAENARGPVEKFLKLVARLGVWWWGQTSPKPYKYHLLKDNWPQDRTSWLRHARGASHSTTSDSALNHRQRGTGSSATGVSLARQCSLSEKQVLSDRKATFSLVCFHQGCPRKEYIRSCAGSKRCIRNFHILLRAWKTNLPQKCRR